MNVDRVKSLIAALQAEIGNADAGSDVAAEKASTRSGNAELKHVSAKVKWNSTGINVRTGDRIDIWADPDYMNVWEVS
ncbi:MAG: hypothetical protein ACKO38_10500, partial [Planctomycetota bacterium]